MLGPVDPYAIAMWVFFQPSAYPTLSAGTKLDLSTAPREGQKQAFALEFIHEAEVLAADRRRVLIISSRAFVPLDAEAYGIGTFNAFLRSSPTHD
jgi:hypothetical protein